MSVGSFRPLGGVETLEEFKRRHPGQTSEQALDTWRAKRRGPSPTTAVPYCMMCCFIIKVSAERSHCRNYSDFDVQCGR